MKFKNYEKTEKIKIVFELSAITKSPNFAKINRSYEPLIKIFIFQKLVLLNILKCSPIESNIVDGRESVDGYQQHRVMRDCLCEYGELTNLPIDDSINEVPRRITEILKCID